MIHRITYATFVASLATALLGGVLFVAWQALGLAFGNAYLLTSPNGVFKTVLCIAASIASVAAYVLVHAKSARPAPEGVR
ncbi:hypothetical protein ACIPVK_08060 [Paeniglutamicibacter sp. MACA_103]|uniref:hypothetical protein n=1 Tax=Paeniglutamicibacter sp. MACA_103 TaxID=3377337 RepID=UPI003892CDF5